MPLSALPERLQDPNAWKGTDMDNIFQRWIIKNPWIHGLFAYGPRAKEWWGRWREIPIVLFAIRGKGQWRWEYTNGLFEMTEGSTTLTKKDSDNVIYNYYLSRVQYFTRWHFQIQWPFVVSFHFYFSQKSVPTFPTRTDTDNKLFYCYFGAHRDSDQIYWFPSAFLGLTWK